MSPEERLWAKVDKEGPVPEHCPDLGPCWLWTGYKGRGYGGIRIRGKDVRTHRFAYELLVGPIPDGLELDHLCRVRHCMNPDHLEPVTTRSENILRGYRARGLKNHCVHGHEYTEASTVMFRGKRQCRICHKQRQRRWQEEHSRDVPPGLHGKESTYVNYRCRCAECCAANTTNKADRRRRARAST